MAPGSTLLVAGDAASGAEVLAKEFAAAEATLYYASDEAREEVRRAVRRVHPRRRLEVVDLTARHRRALAHRGGDGPDALPAALFREVRARRAPRIVVDSVDSLFEAAAPGEVVSALRALRRANHDARGLLYLAKGRGTADPRAEARLEHVADVVVTLAHVDGAVEDTWELHVRKVRNRPQDTGRVAYRPGPDGRLVPDTRRRI